jgi:murein DD-endopeptidase MepM/ murein hydrolase activator NlpD
VVAVMLRGRIKKRQNHLSIMFIPHSEGRVKTVRVFRIFYVFVIVFVIALTSSFIVLGNQISVLKNEKAKAEVAKLDLISITSEQDSKIDEKNDTIDKVLENQDTINERQKDFAELYDTLVKTYLRGRLDMGITSRSETSRDADMNFISEIKELHNIYNQIESIDIAIDEDVQEVKSIKVDFENYLDTIPSLWPADGKLASGFGYRYHPIKKRRLFHYGIDIGGNYNNPIYAAGKGTVMYSGYNSGYGHFIKIEHNYGDGLNLITIYAHLNKKLVKKGQIVEKGEKIGLMGSSGLSTGPHLHFEIRLENNTAIDPLTYLDVNEKK